MTFVEAEHIIA